MLNQSNPKRQGDVGEAHAIAYYTSQGCLVSIPFSDSSEYDLIVDDGVSLKKVQVKTTKYKRNDKFVVALKTKGGNKSRQSTVSFDGSKVDYLFILTSDGDRYSIPTVDFTPTSDVTLSSRYDVYKV